MILILGRHHPRHLQVARVDSVMSGAQNLSMTFEQFKEMIERDRPAVLPVGAVAKVKPAPWILRAGHGKQARIRMVIAGAHRYEREPGGDVWRRVERSEFDVLNDAA
ncbi:MAG TPA: hypothetical protein VKA53_01805 [Thermoanaerobaculia bacterium]|nr:hypothetical protein [Thermoanaerobaculia bacterium]